MKKHVTNPVERESTKTRSIENETIKIIPTTPAGESEEA